MPYKIEKENHGFFVVDPRTGKHYSKHPLPKSRAIKQRAAIAISEAKSKHKKISYFF